MTKIFFPYNDQPKQFSFKFSEPIRFPFYVNDLVYYWEVGSDGITMYLLNNKIDPDTPIVKDLLMHFIKMFGDVGLGLGSQISQILALAAANELDHYIKEDLGIHCYGRYMDDGYLIHHDKEYLKSCLIKIQYKCEELGLKLNLKKTRITPLRRDFQWLKIMFRLTESGYIVKRIWHKSVVRMRRKIKKLKRKLDAGTLEMSDIRASYESWKSHTIGLDAYRTLYSMDKLYHSLFGNEVTG